MSWKSLFAQSKPSSPRPPVTSTTAVSETEGLLSEAPKERVAIPESEEDKFDAQVKSAAQKARIAIENNERQHRERLEAEFGADLKRKAELSQFAKENELDDALIEIWDAIEHFPTWSKRDDFAQYNIIGVTNISETEESEKDGSKKTKSVFFDWDSVPFQVSSKQSWGYQSADLFVYFSIFERGELMFAIKTSAKPTEYGREYSVFDISAFKRRGRWSEFLLSAYSQIRIGREQWSKEQEIDKAKEAQKNFEG